MHYMGSFFVPLKPMLDEWAELAREDKAEILRRLVFHGCRGLVSSSWHSRSRSSRQFLGLAPLAQIVTALSNDHPKVRCDGEAALADILVAVDAVRDFCRVTETRLPDAALGAERRGDWLLATHMAPPMQEQTAAETAAAQEILRQQFHKREQEEKKRADRRKSASSKLSICSGGAVEDRIPVLPVGGSRPRAPAQDTAVLAQPTNVTQMTEPCEAQDGITAPKLVANTVMIPGTPGTSGDCGVVPVKRWAGYNQQDKEIILSIQRSVQEHRISSWAALQEIPDHELPGNGTPVNRRKRIHRKIQKTGNF